MSKITIRIMQGTIEEKIFQRQVSKQVLSNVVDKGTGKTSQFTTEELKVI